MIKKSKALTIIINLICSFTIFAQQIVHEEIHLNSSQFNKSLDTSFAQIYETDRIEVPLKHPEPFLSVGFKASLINQSSFAAFEMRSSLDGIKWNNWQIVLEKAAF